MEDLKTKDPHPLPSPAMPRAGTERIQLEKLRQLLLLAKTQNPFYRQKYAGLEAPEKVNDLADFSARIPFTTKQELIEDQHKTPPYGTNLSFPLAHYHRCHQTSGSAGKPLRWLDTPETWSSMLGDWDQIFQAAGVTVADRLFFAFSFGPFIGFWSAFESATRRGCFCFPGGAMNSEARLRAIMDNRCTVLLCTPTYALHLGQEARELGMHPENSGLRLMIVAGEPGGSIPAVRARLAAYWPHTRIFDHHGMTESGPVTHECPNRHGVLHPIETSFITEIVNPRTGQAVARGETGELILTTLNRTGMPLIRYRSGDLVRAGREEICACGSPAPALEGGIMGRADDMFFIRGVNVYPGAVENIIRGFTGIAEYRVRMATREELPELIVEVEPTPDTRHPEILAQRLRCAFHTALGLRVPVQLAAAGSLPRFEMKGKRWVRDGA